MAGGEDGRAGMQDLFAADDCLQKSDDKGGFLGLHPIPGVQGDPAMMKDAETGKAADTNGHGKFMPKPRSRKCKAA